MKARQFTFLMSFALFAAGLHAQSLAVDSDRFLFSLGLSADQVSQVVAAEEHSRAEAEQTVTDLQATRDELARLLEANEPDMEQVDAAIDREQKERTELERGVIRTQISLRQIMGNEIYRAYRDFVPTEAGLAAFVPYLVQEEIIIAGWPFYPYGRLYPYRPFRYPYPPYVPRYFRGPRIW
jgi:hypothetical protein